MGGGRPSASVAVVPTPAAPQTFQSVIPLTAFEDTAAQLKRIQEETGKIAAQRYQEVGTPAQIGARMAGNRVRESAAYGASIPSGDKYLTAATGKSDQYDPLKQALAAELTEEQKAYAKALTNINDVPTNTVYDTPSWAKRTDTKVTTT